jgi:hypothetical protein
MLTFAGGNDNGINTNGASSIATNQPKSKASL